MKKEWKAFKFSMGFFWAYNDRGKFAIGKCDPITKKVIEWYEIS